MSYKIAIGMFLALLTIGGRAMAKDETLNIYNWSDYIGKDTLAKFSKETGIKVNYDTYGENETLDAKLLAGSSGYDVVFPSSSPFFAQQIKAGVYQALDLSKIPNAKLVDPKIMKLLKPSDPSDEVHGLPYMMAATGFGYNPQKIKKLDPKAPTHSWAMLFDEGTVSKFKSCGVSLLDTPTEVIPAYQIYRHENPEIQTAAKLDSAIKALTKLRSNYRYLSNDKYRSDLVSGDLCLAHGYVGDLVQVTSRLAALGHATKTNIEIVIPTEGAILNIDVMAMPKDAPHKDAAYQFINFILRPDIIAEITNQVGYANAVPSSDRYIKPAIKNNPVIYPPPDVMARLFVAIPPESQDYERLRTRAWTRFRTAP